MMPFALLTLLAALDATPQAPSSANCAPALAFTGTICTPATGGKHPAILLLGGSEGGDSMAKPAARFASEGYVAASVAYFGVPGLPHSLQLVPIETVGKALDDVKKRDDVDARRIAAFGISKGGELVLLAASTYPAIHAVIADVPSPFAWEGIPEGATDVHESSWTFHDKPLPFVPYTDDLGHAFAMAYSMQTPLELRPAYDAALKNTSAVDAAMFHLDRINGPVLFLSAGDDRIWDSVAQARLGLAYLAKEHHRFPDASKEYPVAGHIFLFATAARPFVSTPFAGGLTLELGGTPKTNIDAAADAWPRVRKFLEGALRPR